MVRMLVSAPRGYSIATSMSHLEVLSQFVHSISLVFFLEVSSSLPDPSGIQD